MGFHGGPLHELKFRCVQDALAKHSKGNTIPRIVSNVTDHTTISQIP